jgi:hypothetical protein
LLAVVVVVSLQADKAAVVVALEVI